MKSELSNTPRSIFFAPLLIGALWNVLFGSLGFFNLPLHISLFYNVLTPTAAIIANKMFWLFVLAMGLGYSIVAFVPNKYRFLITFGAAGKIQFSLFVVWLWLNSITTNFALLIAIGDLL